MFAAASKRVLPGFTLSLGTSLLFVCLILLLPLSALVMQLAQMSWAQYWDVVTNPQVVAAYKVTLLSAFVASIFNGVFGLLMAWILTRYRFPGRTLLDALMDLPFALPTAVAGIALTALYAPNGAFGVMARDLGIKIAYTPLGIFIALVFVGLPFVVRTVQPVIDEIEREVEEASATLGASRAHTLRHVILPMLMPAALTGFALSLARAVGEYGSVIFIAGNLPLKTEIAPLLIVIKLEEFNYDGATAIGIIFTRLLQG